MLSVLNSHITTTIISSLLGDPHENRGLLSDVYYKTHTTSRANLEPRRLWGMVRHNQWNTASYGTVRVYSNCSCKGLVSSNYHAPCHSDLTRMIHSFIWFVFDKKFKKFSLLLMKGRCPLPPTVAGRPSLPKRDPAWGGLELTATEEVAGSNVAVLRWRVKRPCHGCLS